MNSSQSAFQYLLNVNRLPRAIKYLRKLPVWKAETKKLTPRKLTRRSFLKTWCDLGGKLVSKFKEEKYCVYEESVIKRKNWRTKKVLRN